MNSSIGKWIKSIIIIYQCFTHLKLLVQIQAELGDWLDGISRNPRYLNEDNFKSEVNFKSENQKNKKVFQQRQTAPHSDGHTYTHPYIHTYIHTRLGQINSLKGSYT